MEANKENVRGKVRTKIPLPLDPLPALPEHLLNKHTEKSTRRLPLETLAQTNIPSTSNDCKVENICKPNSVIKVDPKHVTTRKNTESLDWDYLIFMDKDNDNVIVVSDDEDLGNDGGSKSNCHEDCVAITPVKSPVVHKSVRNIKRSLKRPHSRELQGLSPPVRQKKNEEEKVKRRLVFSDTIQERLKSPDYWERSYMICLDRDYTDHMLDYLLKVERKPLAPPHITRITRACVINWLMKVNGPLGNPAIIQSALWYLDSILGVGRVQLDKLQLLATACYWIAQKLHGPVATVGKLVKHANHAFSPRKLLAYERAVLRKLDFPPQPVVPHEFITYLAWWCDNKHPGEIEVAATFICMSGLMVESQLCEEYPSVIAAASVRNAVLLLRKKDVMKHVLHCPMYRASERKATSLTYTCALLRRAVKTVSDPIYEYKAPMDHYGQPPHNIAQKIVNIINKNSYSNNCAQSSSHHHHLAPKP